MSNKGHQPLSMDKAILNALKSPSFVPFLGANEGIFLSVPGVPQEFPTIKPHLMPPPQPHPTADTFVIPQSDPGPAPASPALGTHELIKQMVSHSYADITPTYPVGGGIYASQPKRGEETTMQGANNNSIQQNRFVREEDVAQIETLLAYPEGQDPYKEKEAGQGSAETAEGGASEEQPEAQEAEQEAPVDEYKRPWWISGGKDPKPNVFYCEHPEAAGRFVINRPSIGRELAADRIRERESAGEVSEAGHLLADMIAMCSVGFSEFPASAPHKEDNPKQLAPAEFASDELAYALYREVVAYWATFRERLTPQRTV